MKKKNSHEWTATHDDEPFGSLRKPCDVTEHSINKNFQHWIIAVKKRINIEFHHPVLVLQGGLLEARGGGKFTKLLEANRVQFRGSTIAGKEEKTFQVDVVTEKQFLIFLRMIERKVEKTARSLRRRFLCVEDAMCKLVRRARRLRSPDKIQKALEF